MRRLCAVGAAIVVCLALGAVPVTAQEVSPAAAVESEVLYEIMVPATAIPDALGKIAVDEWYVRPGADESIPYDNEGILGRGMLVESGELVVTPAYDALLWTGETARGGSPVTAPAGQAASLATGDVLLLPAVPREELDPTGEVRIANPGTTDAVVFSFHMHWWENFPGWPMSIKSTQGITFSNSAELDRVQAGDTLFRLSRLTAQPGAVLPFPEDAAIAFDYLASGAMTTGQLTWSLPGAGLGLRAAADPPLRATDDAPAVVLELAVLPMTEPLPAATLAPTAPPASPAS